jgi:anti-anti-sigma factor
MPAQEFNATGGDEAAIVDGGALARNPGWRRIRSRAGAKEGRIAARRSFSVSPEPAAVSATGFKIHSETRDDAVIVHCSGRLTNEHSGLLKTHVKGVLPHAKKIIVDLQELNRMDSSGLGAIVGSYVSAKKENCEFLVINYNSASRDLFGITNVLSMFEDCGRTGMRMP